jgi:uncharacterized membrane protein
MRREKIILTLGVAGTLFAGYLSGVKFFRDTCAFNESCPYFLGYPACYDGLVMYLAITVAAVVLVTRRTAAEKARKAIVVVSGLGILFAGYFTLREFPLLFSEGFRAYVLGLPSCALGLIFYLVIFFLALLSRQGFSQNGGEA